MRTSPDGGASGRLTHVPIAALGLSVSGFLAISFIICLLLGFVTPDAGMHRPWLQFFPGFEWLTARGVVIGLIWTQVYGWYTALVLGSLFNVFAGRSSAGSAS